MAYDKRLETNRAAKAKHDESQKSAARARLDKVASQVKAKKRAKKEVAA